MGGVNGKQNRNYKISAAQLEKIPYVLIIGDKEVETNTVSVRGRNGKQMNGISLESFLTEINAKIMDKK